MASLETVLKFAVPAVATICLIFQAFQHFRKKKKTSEQKNADKNSNDLNADSSISDVANKSDVEVEEEEEAGAVAKEDGENVVKTETEDGVNTHDAKFDCENVVKTEMEDGVNTNDANRNEMVQNTGDKHRTIKSSGDGGSMLGCGDVHVSKTGTDHAKQAEMVQKSADGKNRANLDNFSMGDLHSDNTEVPIKPGESSDGIQSVKSTCTSLSDKSDTQSLYEIAELDLESVRRDDIENGNKSNNSATVNLAQLDSDSGCVSMESNVSHTVMPNRAVS